MKLKYVVFILVLWALGAGGCDKERKNHLSVPMEVIDFTTLEMRVLSEILDEKESEYVLLKSGNVKELLGRIDKMKVVDDKIYIADTRMRSLVVYDCMGNYLAQVGIRGQGPKEYVNLSDFDVDANGNVYVLDGRLNKMLQYNNDYECVEECMLPFEADNQRYDRERLC